MRPLLPLLAFLAFLAFLAAALPAAQATNLCDEALTKKLVAEVEAANRGQTDCNCVINAAKRDDEEPKPRWKLFWGDDFKYTGTPDPKKWAFDIGGDGWGNNEEQYYSNDLKNARADGHKLILEADRVAAGGTPRDYDGRKYTSARINSVPSFTYGRIVYRAKLPRGKGSWPAAWLIAAKQVYGTNLWPDNGEIDVVEEVGHEQNNNHISVHSLDHNFVLGSQHTATIEVEGGDTAFHDYAVDWLPDHMDFYVDGKKFSTLKKKPGESWRTWPFDQDMKLRINLTVGGNWGNQQGIDDAAFPMKFEIESVKVYAPLDPEDCTPKKIEATGSVPGKK